MSNVNSYPLFSIITPSFNSMPFIKENIESVKSQCYPNIEHIIIDGGSKDGTIELLKKYPHLIWVSEKDNGQSEAINKGFKMSKGEIIGWLNSDDYYNTGAVSLAANYLIENKNIDLIYSDIEVVNEKNQFIRLIKGEPFSIEKFLKRNLIPQPSVFMKKRVIEELKGVNENLNYVMDRELWLRAALFFNLKYIPDKILAKFRFCHGTKSYENAPEFHLEWINILKEFEKKIDSNIKIIKKIRNSIKYNEMLYYFSQSVFKSKNSIHMRKNLLKAVSIYPMSIFKIGTWKLLVREIIKFYRGKNDR